jgi:hypothetical protein
MTINEKTLDGFLTNYTVGITQTNFLGVTFSDGATFDGATGFSYKEIIRVYLVGNT